VHDGPPLNTSNLKYIASVVIYTEKMVSLKVILMRFWVLNTVTTADGEIATAYQMERDLLQE
jgi:hypothetical protein